MNGIKVSYSVSSSSPRNYSRIFFFPTKLPTASPLPELTPPDSPPVGKGGRYIELPLAGKPLQASGLAQGQWNAGGTRGVVQRIDPVICNTSSHGQSPTSACTPGPTLSGTLASVRGGSNRTSAAGAPFAGDELSGTTTSLT
jgi:hypothetical protein